MTIKNAVKLIGRCAVYNVHAWGRSKAPTMRIKVKIADVRQSFNRTEAYVIPLAGSGYAWVDIRSLTLAK